MQAIERNEIFDLAYRFATETGENIFLTGKAGTGKTTLLRYLKEHSTKNIIIAAPTGVAAINAGGVTLHSLFQLPFHPHLPTPAHKAELLSKTRINKQRQQLLRKMELLVIDEVSMVRCDVMDAIDTLLKSVRKNPRLPFGGVQLLCIGDLYQLSPVAQTREWDILSEFYDSPFFFDSLAIRSQPPLLIELTKIYRQKQEDFVLLLNKVRNNEMEDGDFERLHQRYIPGFKPPEGENYITLTTHNNSADQINRLHLRQLNATPYGYRAVIDNDFPEHLYPADPELFLKVGAQVMFLKNDAVRKRYYNGKIGTVCLLQEDKIVVDCDGTEIEVTKEVWENTRYTLNRKDGKLQQETLGSFTQYPLRLAWAITIHKSQGLTFEKVMIDAGASFGSGQVYVALSRCTSLEGIVLLSKIPPSAIHNNENVLKGQEYLKCKGPLADRFAGARLLFTLQVLEEIFMFKEPESALETLGHHLNQQKDKFKKSGEGPGAEEWIKTLRLNFDREKETGIKFLARISSYLSIEPVIEKNAALQKRLSDAANHFISKFTEFLRSVQNHPLLTEHKEAATLINEDLENLYVLFYTVEYHLRYCLGPFALTGFLHHKLNFDLPRVQISCYATEKKQAHSDIPNPELYETLRRWRDLEVEESGMPIFMVASQATLRDLCTYLPMNKTDLLKISGFGKKKVERFGEVLVEILLDYCGRHNLKSNMAELVSHPKRERKEKDRRVKQESKNISLEMFRAGKSISEIAKERGLAQGTVEGHLTQFIGSGEILINEVVTPEVQKVIRGVLLRSGPGNLRELVEKMPPGINYSQVRMVLAAEKPVQ